MKVQTYYRYMMGRVKEDSIVGDLARDMKSDKSFPKDETRHNYIRRYLERCDACQGCYTAFERSWEEYVKVRSDETKE